MLLLYLLGEVSFDLLRFRLTIIHVTTRYYFTKFCKLVIAMYFFQGKVLKLYMKQYYAQCTARCNKLAI